MKFLSILLLFGASLWAQNDGTLLLSTGSPAAPSQISVTLTGPQGPQTFCYWVVARYPVGNASAVQPQCITTAPNTLTAQNFITITWTPLQGATGYDVVRLPGQTLQSCTNCLVASNIPTTSKVDNGASLSNYTVLNVGGQSCVFYINNRDYPTARVIEQCTLPFQFGQCIIFPDLTQQCTAAGGGGTGVTLINTTTPVTGGPITTTGTIACPTCVVGVTGGAPIVSSGGTTPNITCPTCTVGGTTTVTASAPITSSGGATPNIACPTCYFGTPTQHDVMLMALTQQVTAVPPSTSGYVLTSNGPSSDPSFQPATACPTCLLGTPANHGTIISSATQTVSVTSTGTAGQVLTSNGAGSDPTYQNSQGLTCNKYTVTQSPFGTTWTVTGQSGQAVSGTTSQTINLVTLASKTAVNMLRIKPTTAFAGTGITKMTMSVGTTATGGSVTSFEPAFILGGSGNFCTGNTVPFATSDSPFGDCPGYLDDGGSISGADNGETWTLTFNSTGGNLTATTAGSVDITQCITTLP